MITIAVAGLCGCEKTSPPARNAVAVTNTFLASAVNDLTNCGAEVICLTGPGMCPGHFDIRPGQIDEMRSACILLRMDFQKSLDGRLKSLTGSGMSVGEIKITGGLCQPDSYLEACRQIADLLVQAGVIEKAAAEKRLNEITGRIENIAKKNLARVAKLKNAPVIASVHQSKFCEWLGLRAVSTYYAADTELPGNINQTVIKAREAGVKIVVANRPEGSRLANALSERLDAKVAMFDNFPAAGKKSTAFDELLESNVNALLEASCDGSGN